MSLLYLVKLKMLTAHVAVELLQKETPGFIPPQHVSSKFFRFEFS